MSTLNELVRDQILAESPQMDTAQDHEWYVNDILRTLNNVELLERISDAFDKHRNLNMRSWP